MVEKEIKISDHELVPKHVILSEEEAMKVLESFNVSMKQMPKILKKDPVIKELEAKPGDMVKIIRKSPTTKTSEFYRVVSGG